MVWPFMSPHTGEGPCTVVDIGAATTTASWFRIHSGRDEDGTILQKATMSFFGAETRAPGMDRYDQILAIQLGVEDPVRLRGQEARLVRRAPSSMPLEDVVDRYHKTWAQARCNAWQRAPKLKHWSRLQILVVGGGSKLEMVDRRFRELLGYLKGKLPDARRLAQPGIPGDLFELESRSNSARRFREEPTFLLVAYGLSFHSGDLPEVNLPGQVPPFRYTEIRRAFVSAEELGYDNP